MSSHMTARGTVKRSMRTQNTTGMFVTFEGIEGCGKSTHAKRAYQYLCDHGVRALLTREPGGTPVGESIRRLLLDPQTEVTSLAELFLYEAARADHMERVVLPALARREVVICDRFGDSTLAYQSFGRGLPRTLVLRCNAIAAHNRLPDLTILIDVPVRTGLARARRVTGSARQDRFENESVAFHEHVRRGFVWLRKKQPRRIRTVLQRARPDETFACITPYLDAVIARVRQYKTS